MTHVELIDPMEKLSPELGGTGYVGPREPASVRDLLVNAEWAATTWPELDMTVWKVLRTSVDWSQWSKTRRLRVGGRTISCEVIGSVKDWWLVSVKATKAAEILGGIPLPSPEALP